MENDQRTQQTRERAYQLWQEQGQPDGQHQEHWAQAEQELAQAPEASSQGQSRTSKQPRQARQA